MACQGVRARGGGAGIAQRGARGTRRARVSSDECDNRGNQGKKAGEPEGHGRAGGGGSRGPTTAQRNTKSRAEKRHAEDPH